MSDDMDLDEGRVHGPDESVRGAMVAALMEHDAKLDHPSEPLELEAGLRWVPDLRDASRVVHVELGEQIPKAFTRRLHAANAAGWNVVVATKAQALTFETLMLLQQLEVAPFELSIDDASAWRVSEWNSVADWVARANMALRPAELRELVSQYLAVAEDQGRTNHARGRAYEEALCLIFSQVSWLKVAEHAYRNDTEEIDIVLLVTGAGGYARLAGGPLAIATAKNEKKPLGSATIKYLHGQMGNRRDRCKLGFACSRGAVSKAAHQEILGLRHAGVVIVPMGEEHLALLLEDADRLDERLAELVIAATLS